MGRPSKYKNGWPGVTDIVGLLTNLQFWYGRYGTKECERIKRESQDIGHRVHKGVEDYLENKDALKAARIVHDENERQMVYQFVNYIERKKLKAKHSEKTMYSTKYQYGGTADYIDKEIIDWKTDSVPRDKASERERQFKYKLQLAGYAIAWEEETGKKIKVGRIFRVSKNLQVREYKFQLTAKLKKQFISLREIYRELKGK